MKKIISTLLLTVVSVCAYAQINAQCPQFTATGAPQYAAQSGDQEICHQNYAVIHRCSVKAPIAVMEHLTVSSMSGGNKRRDDFRADPAVAPQCQAQLSDYAGNPYDRGHMSPAAHNTQTAEIMSESFFLSNMVPQNPNNNRGAWRILESWTRDWAKSGGDFYIISGGIYDQGHPVIGNGVGVPTRLYKIVIEKNSGRVMAYLMPNAPLPVADLPKYQTSVGAIEQASGISFTGLPKN